MKTKTTDKSVKAFAKKYFPKYTGRTIYLNVTDRKMNLTSCWGGGSRDYFVAVNLSTGAILPIPENGSGYSAVDRVFGHSGLPEMFLAPGFAVVEHTIFCGKDCGLTVHIHPDNATKYLTA